MAERSLRGTNLSALSMETDANVVLSERQLVRYVCPEQHIIELPFSVEADVPPVWECRCGLEAKLLDAPGVEQKPVKAVRTHWDMLLERRSIPELEELLEERLTLLRESRGEKPTSKRSAGTRRRTAIAKAPAHRPGPFAMCLDDKHLDVHPVCAPGQRI